MKVDQVDNIVHTVKLKFRHMNLSDVLGKLAIVLGLVKNTEIATLMIRFISGIVKKEASKQVWKTSHVTCSTGSTSPLIQASRFRGDFG